MGSSLWQMRTRHINKAETVPESIDPVPAVPDGLLGRGRQRSHTLFSFEYILAICSRGGPETYGLLIPRRWGTCVSAV